MRAGRRIHYACFCVAVLGLAAAACDQKVVLGSTGVSNEEARISFPARASNKYDILFVIDNSGSMVSKQENLGTNFARLVNLLRDPSGKPLDYRIAVASTDVGAGGYLLDPGGATYGFDICNTPGPNGSAGILQTSVHTDPVDWERSESSILTACGDDSPPDGSSPIPPADLATCDRLKANRQWLLDNCDGQALDKATPWIENNAKLNRSQLSVATQFRCIGSLGVNGCFVEQPLEAARAALRANKTTFLRPDAYLAVVFLTDETDCSAKDTTLFDPLHPGLNPDVNLRCYVGARDCASANAVTLPGGDYTQYGGCTDSAEYLYPVDEYREFFQNEIKGPGAKSMVVLSGIIGNADYTRLSASPTGPGPQAADVQLLLAGDLATGQSLVSTCSSDATFALPNPRIAALLELFANPDDYRPSSTSICSDDFTPALAQIGGRMQRQLSTTCVAVPPSVAAADANSACLMEEVGADGFLRLQAIPSSRGWRVTPGSPSCVGNPVGSAAMTIDPALRQLFAPSSSLVLKCPTRS